MVTQKQNKFGNKLPMNRNGNFKGNGNANGNRRFKQGRMGQKFMGFNGRNGGGGMNNIQLPSNMGTMYNTNQMLDNPGYMDFNEPSPCPPPVQQIQPSPNKIQHLRNNRRNQQNRQANGNGNWPQNRRQGMHNGMQMNHNQKNNFRGNGPIQGRMRSMPIPPMPMRPPLPPPPMNMNGRFGMRPPPHQMSRPLPPPPMGCPPINPLGVLPMINMRRGGMQPNGRANRKGKGNLRNSKGNVRNRRRNGKQNKGNKGGKQQQQTYSLEKPWVNDEIREAHKQKEELQNKLKGNKNDELFAEFKIQRDKFVSLYTEAMNVYNEAQKNADNINQTPEKQEESNETNITTEKNDITMEGESQVNSVVDISDLKFTYLSDIHIQLI